MTWRKLQALIWKELHTTFTDSSLILIMIVAPLAIATIVGFVFGGLGGSEDSFTIENIPVVVVNLDEGSDQQNFGEIFVSAMLPPAATDDDAGLQVQTCPLLTDESDSGGMESEQGELYEIFSVTLMDEREAARTGVDQGDYAAAVIIPADFSAQLAPQIPARDLSAEPILIEVYGNSNDNISASIVQSVVRGFVNQFLTGNITIETAISTLIDYNPLAAGLSANRDDVQAVLGCAFSGGFETVSLDAGTVSGDADVEAEEVEAEQSNQLSGFAELLVSVGSAQAVFFALFAAQQGIISIVTDRRAGTLQRLMVSPTSRLTILGGKLLGTLVTVIFQVTLILLALLLIASVMEGELLLIWGTNLPAIALVVLSLGLAVCGLGVFMSGLARTPEQVGTIGSVVNLIIGIAGGAFGFAPPVPFAYISMIYWGVDAFQKLAVGEVDILLNVVVLLGQAVVLFFIGAWLFGKRVEA